MIGKLKEKRRRYILSRPLPKYRKIFSFLPEKGIFLDAGCGRAELSKYILSKNPNVKLIGCDTGTKPEYKNKNFKYYQKDLNQRLPFKKKFDVIIFADVLEHLEKPQKILAQASRYANKFIISIPNLNFFMYKIYPKLENPPQGESQHLHHWKPEGFLKLIPKNFKVVRKEYCSDFPEFRWTHKLFPKSNFFNQTLILKIVKNK